MRLLFLLILLLPSSLFSQVKALMPVVVKDASGKAVTNLKLTDFQVSGPKTSKVTDVSLVPAEASEPNENTSSVTVLFDASNIPTNRSQLNIREIRGFLGDVASRRLAVTFLVNT